MMAHQRSGIGNLRIRQYMEQDYIVPVDFEHMLYIGQLLQADAIRTAIESHRADMPFCMGSLYWQLNDVWPVASWSSIDYFGRWKALHYTVREAFKPAILVVNQNDSTLDISIVSDMPESRPVTVEAKIRDFFGNNLWTGVYKREMTSRSVTSSLSIPISEILYNHDLPSIVLETSLLDKNNLIDRDFHYFVPPKDLQLQDPEIDLEFFEEEGKYVVMLRSASLAKNVFLVAEGFEGRFSDNFFDLMPGSTYAVSFPKESTFESFSDSVKILHLQMTTP
jgi:beta-mannosidase